MLFLSSFRLSYMCETADTQGGARTLGMHPGSLTWTGWTTAGGEPPLEITQSAGGRTIPCAAVVALVLPLPLRLLLEVLQVMPRSPRLARVPPWEPSVAPPS